MPVSHFLVRSIMEYASLHLLKTYCAFRTYGKHNWPYLPDIRWPFPPRVPKQNNEGVFYRRLGLCVCVCVCVCVRACLLVWVFSEAMCFCAWQKITVIDMSILSASNCEPKQLHTRFIGKVATLELCLRSNCVPVEDNCIPLSWHGIMSLYFTLCFSPKS